MGDIDITHNRSGSLVISGNHATLFGLITTGRPGPGGVGRGDAGRGDRAAICNWLRAPAHAAMDGRAGLEHRSTLNSH